MGRVYVTTTAISNADNTANSTTILDTMRIFFHKTYSALSAIFSTAILLDGPNETAL